MEFVFVLSVIFLQIFWRYFPEVVQVIGAFIVYAFMDDKARSVFLVNERMRAIRAAQYKRLIVTVFRAKEGLAYFAEALAFRAVIGVKERLWSITSGADTIIRDIAY